MCGTPLKRCAALDMCTAILRVLRIIASIPKAAPVVTAARTITTPAWGIYLSIAMEMAAAILMSMSRQSMMTAAVAMITESMKVIIMSMSTMNVAVAMSTTMNMKSMSTMNVVVAMSTTMSMKSISTMNVAVAMSIIMAMNTTFRGIQRIVSAKFAILMRSIAISVAKA